MTVFHVETQQDYNALMVELEEKGCKWRGGEKPTHLDKFRIHGKGTYFYEECGLISFSDGDHFKAYYSNETLIEYKSKGENMAQEEITQEEMKQEEMKRKLQKNAFDVYVAVDIFAVRGVSESEKDLQKAKTSAKSLIEKIDEYLETLKPKFKVGDYVTDTSDDDPFICKIERIEGIVISGRWYCVSDNYFDRLVELPMSSSRLSTPEEVKLYESALNFHKNGRKPFEVKEGDLVESKSGRNIIVFYPENYSRVSFLKDGWEFLKTAEEVSEWIRGE